MRDPIDDVAGALARKAIHWNPAITIDPEDIRYHLALRINFYLVIFGALIISALLHNLINTTACLITFYYLRKFTGGAHIPNLTGCAIVTVTLMIGAPMIDEAVNVPFVLNLATAALVLIFTERRHKVWLALGIIAIGAALNCGAVTLILLAQAVTLIRKEVR